VRCGIAGVWPRVYVCGSWPGFMWVWVRCDCVRVPVMHAREIDAWSCKKCMCVIEWPGTGMNK
jgi:hypothetical protein